MVLLRSDLKFVEKGRTVVEMKLRFTEEDKHLKGSLTPAMILDPMLPFGK